MTRMIEMLIDVEILIFFNLFFMKLEIIQIVDFFGIKPINL
jgi:hypothetical protein